jgi:hypothetical protein
MKGRNLIPVLFMVGTSGRGKGEYGWCIIYLYENKTVKPIEIVLRRGREGWGGMMKGMNLHKVCCKHIWKCDNEPSCITVC